MRVDDLFHPSEYSLNVVVAELCKVSASSQPEDESEGLQHDFKV